MSFCWTAMESSLSAQWAERSLLAGSSHPGVDMYEAPSSEL